jgi:uncharacterized protein YndB with AHSA1/START domain
MTQMSSSTTQRFDLPLKQRSGGWQRRRWMIWLLAGVGAVAGMIALAAIIGTFLPETHTAARTLRLRQAPEAVWQAITDRAQQSAWRTELQSIERFPERGGREVWQEVYRNGDRLTLEASEVSPPRRLVTHVADADAPFSGRWEYELTPAEGGCYLTITEIGQIPNPLFRFVNHFVIGQATTIERYLKALAAKFGEPAVMQ